ncbi:MAG: hypothetical protein GC189_12730 [Alphaproteobacteria bacterium]|nr:hypothetical protein [Alphaproteobacteria bacterium]
MMRQVGRAFTIWAKRSAVALAALTMCAAAAPALAQVPLSDAPAQSQVSTPAPPASPGADLTADALAPTDEGYILGVGDRVRVVVFGEASLSGDFVVDSTGNIALPLLGQVPAAGLSLQAFQRGVQGALVENLIMNNPRVTAEVMNFRPFYILGEVARPGEYQYQNGLSVLNAVATAGGFAPLANQTVVYIKRAGEELETRYALTAEMTVQPGDTVRIAKGAFYILGEVNSPGEYPYSPGMTLRNAVAAAGGFTYRANQSRAYIQRQGEPDEESYRIRPDLLVQPGDTIRITERFF